MDINEISKHLETQRQNERKKTVTEFYISIIAKSYEKASAYSNLIIVAGYALFFTFWGNVREEVSVFWGRISILSVIVSALFFITWEIGMMIYTSLMFRRMHNLTAVSPDKIEAAIERFKKEEEKSHAKMARFWFFELLTTIIPGFAGALILVALYVKKLF